MSLHCPTPGLQRLGLDKELDRLKVIHIAGTKGKGSTAAFAESILRASGYTTGLFTSPHLIDVRERIRINGCGAVVGDWPGPLVGGGRASWRPCSSLPPSPLLPRHVLPAESW